MTNVKRKRDLSARQLKALKKVDCKTPAQAMEKLQKKYKSIKEELSKLGTEINQGYNKDVIKQAEKTQKMFDGISDLVDAAW